MDPHFQMVYVKAQKDPATPYTEMQSLMVEQGELLAYMNPTPEQAKQAAENALKIARLSLDVFDYYKRYY